MRDYTHTRTSFDRICDHVETAIIGRRKEHQPYGVFEDRGEWFAAPLWWIQERGYRVARVWRAARQYKTHEGGNFGYDLMSKTPRAQFSR
ncbi:hypothetical protein [Taklimakanibacter deserti]|uniref:hypothetical protein n=1 Tax=Taklimakanibacter deserti TaxID=2267839 RepID=UPI000E649A90